MTKKLDCENEWFVLRVEDVPQHSCRDTFLEARHIITQDMIDNGYIWTCSCGLEIEVEIEVVQVNDSEATDVRDC